MGHETESGAWVAPVDFFQARTMPKEELDVYQGLDHFLGQMKRHKAKKKKKQGVK